MSPAEKIEKVKKLSWHFRAKRDLHRGKWDRARKHETRAQHYNLYCRYRDLDRRLDELLRLMRYRGENALERRVGRDVKRMIEEGRWAGRLSRKEEGRQAFLSKHKFAPWFMSDSLGADYGTFTCDKCGRGFYHSPSTIRLGGKEKYHCCCGYCTNALISRDWNCQPYL